MTRTLGTVLSISGVPVRLTMERWSHIVEAHDYMAGPHEWVMEVVAEPDAVGAGSAYTLLATQHRNHTPISEIDIIVAYRELGLEDGFVVTAFMTSRVDKALRRGVIWQRST